MHNNKYYFILYIHIFGCTLKFENVYQQISILELKTAILYELVTVMKMSTISILLCNIKCGNKNMLGLL